MIFGLPEISRSEALPPAYSSWVAQDEIVPLLANMIEPLLSP
jgi:hypothetical protein